MQLKHLSAALVCACMLGAMSTGWAAFADTLPMEKVAYKAGKTRVNNQYRDDKAACARLTGQRQDLCNERATASHRLARAELKYDYTGTPTDRKRLQLAQADTGYVLAMEKCLPLAASPRDVCLGQAKVAFGRI